MFIETTNDDAFDVTFHCAMSTWWRRWNCKIHFTEIKSQCLKSCELAQLTDEVNSTAFGWWANEVQMSATVTRWAKQRVNQLNTAWSHFNFQLVKFEVKIEWCGWWWREYRLWRANLQFQNFETILIAEELQQFHRCNFILFLEDVCSVWCLAIQCEHIQLWNFRNRQQRAEKSHRLRFNMEVLERWQLYAVQSPFGADWRSMTAWISTEIISLDEFQRVEIREKLQKLAQTFVAVGNVQLELDGLDTIANFTKSLLIVIARWKSIECDVHILAIHRRVLVIIEQNLPCQFLAVVNDAVPLLRDTWRCHQIGEIQVFEDEALFFCGKFIKVHLMISWVDATLLASLKTAAVGGVKFIGWAFEGTWQII